MKKSAIVLLSTFFLVLILSSCSVVSVVPQKDGRSLPTGKYNTKGTPEFNSFTKKLLGKWQIVSFKTESYQNWYKGINYVPGIYKKAYLTFELDEFFTATFEFYPSKRFIKRRARNVKIDDYKLMISYDVNAGDDTITKNFSVANLKTFIQLSDLYKALNFDARKLDIKGRGRNFDSFYAKEAFSFNVRHFNWPNGSQRTKAESLERRKEMDRKRGIVRMGGYKDLTEKEKAYDRVVMQARDYRSRGLLTSGPSLVVPKLRANIFRVRFSNDGTLRFFTKANPPKNGLATGYSEVPMLEVVLKKVN